jgi:hypothetical protein
MALTPSQIRALAFLTAGYSSEIQNGSAFRLSWAMQYSPDGKPLNNSGYSIGVLQSDFGQRNYLVDDFVSSYFAWAKNDPDRLVERTSDQLSSVLKLNGRALVPNSASADLSKRPLSKDELSKFGEFLLTPEGRQAVWDADIAQIDGKLLPFADRVQQSMTFMSFSDPQDQAFVLTALMKLYNQSEGWGNSLLRQMNSEELSWSEIRTSIQSRPSYIRTGFDHPMEGVALYNRVAESQTVLSGWLLSLDTNRLTQTEFSSDPRYQILERIFRDAGGGNRFVDALENGKPAVLVLPRNLEGQAAAVAVDRFGTIYSQGTQGGNRLIAGETAWRTYQSNTPEGQSYSPGIRRVDGKWVIALGEVDIELSDQAIAQVNINGIEVTLDASKPGLYAFLDSGDLVYAERNGALISGTRLTGDNPGNFEVEFRGGSAANPDIRLVNFGTSDPVVDSPNDYRFVQTDAQGRVTTTDISPITRNIDGIDVIVGSSRFVGITQNGQPISQTSTELQTQAGTGNQITTTDAKLYSNGVLSSHTETTQTSSASGLIPIETVIKTFGAQGTLVQTSTTTPDPDGSQNTIVRNGRGTTLYTSNVRYFDDDAGQSSLTETTYPNGRIETLATDTTGTPASLRITIPAGNNTETVDAYTFDASGQRVFRSSTTTETFYDENGSSRIETVTIPFGGSLVTTRQVYDTDGVLVSSEPIATGSQANANVSNPQTTAVLNDISGLIGAIQGGRPLPILNSGVRLINTFANPAGSAIQYPGLNQASGALSGLASLYNLSNALQNGSDLDKLSASLNTLNYVNSTLPTLLSGAGAAPLSAGLNGFLNGTGGGLINGGAPGAIPVIGLVLSIKNGDPFGTVSGIIGIVNPALLTTPVGWILAIASIVYALNKETPESWGTARIIFDANGQVGIDTVGEGSGPQRVRQQLENTLAALNQQIADVRLANPNALIGIVPQRTPSITWREQRQDDQGYAIVDIDPVTGEQRYPYLRFEQSVNTINLVAAPAILYWAGGLKDIENEAVNDDFWREAA